jgi:quinol monooxygenase YgiN
VADARLTVAELHGLAGRRGELADLLAALAEGARAEAGCHEFRVAELADPGEFLVIGRWDGEDALRAHYATPHYRRYRDAVGELLARPSDVVVHHVSQTVHAVDPDPPDPGRLG